VSVSITSAIIAITSIAFSYFVTDGLLHSREIGGKPPVFEKRPLLSFIVQKIFKNSKLFYHPAGGCGQQRSFQQGFPPNYEYQLKISKLWSIIYKKTGIV